MARPAGVLTTTRCATCETEFSHLLSMKRKYCSYACRNLKARTIKVGDVIGNLTVKRLIPAGEAGNRSVHLECLCACGNTTITRMCRVKYGSTRSCGCLKGRGLITHGLTRNGKPSKEYWVWDSMKRRCSDPHQASYKNYGGRGIKVAPRWMSFANFFADMCPRPAGDLTLERRDNDGDYSPENCYWATRKEQASNTRKNVRATFNGVTLIISEWARRFGVDYKTAYRRLEKTGTIHVKAT